MKFRIKSEIERALVMKTAANALEDVVSAILEPVMNEAKSMNIVELEEIYHLLPSGPYKTEINRLIVEKEKDQNENRL